MTEDDGSKKRILLPIKDKQNRLIQRVGDRVTIDEGEEEEDEVEEVVDTEAPQGLEDDEGFESGTGGEFIRELCSFICPTQGTSIDLALELFSYPNLIIFCKSVIRSFYISHSTKAICPASSRDDCARSGRMEKKTNCQEEAKNCSPVHVNRRKAGRKNGQIKGVFWLPHELI